MKAIVANVTRAWDSGHHQDSGVGGKLWAVGRGVGADYIANMTHFKIKNLKLLSCCLSFWYTLLFGYLQLVSSSEFPERECCDLTTTSTVSPLPVPPAAQPTDRSLSVTTTLQTISVGRSGKQN